MKDGKLRGGVRGGGWGVRGEGMPLSPPQKKKLQERRNEKNGNIGTLGRLGGVRDPSLEREWIGGMGDGGG